MINLYLRNTNFNPIIVALVRRITMRCRADHIHSRAFLAAASMVPHGKLYHEKGLPAPECVLVVDSGFSFTHVVPMINGAVVWDAVKR